MRSSRLSLFATAVPAFAAGLVVLAIAGVGKGVWTAHLIALGLTCLLGLFVRLPRASARTEWTLYAICVVTLAGIGAPLLGDASGPERWLRMGPFNLYMAPLLLPSFLGACAALRGSVLGAVVITLAGVLLAVQPDASQALALLGGMTALCASDRGGGWRQWTGVAGLVLAAIWAFAQPDPLEPVPYVEGVFALALGHSLLAGALVAAGAAALLGGLCWWASRHARWMLAVAAYYGVLFACSVAGLTPAPLVGFGAGPLLGFGLLVAYASSAGERGAATSR